MMLPPSVVAVVSGTRWIGELGSATQGEASPAQGISAAASRESSPRIRRERRKVRLMGDAGYEELGRRPMWRCTRQHARSEWGQRGICVTCTRAMPDPPTLACWPRCRRWAVCARGETPAALRCSQ